MKLLLSCCVAAFLIDIGAVQAQVATTATGANPVVVLREPGYYGYGCPYDYARSATSFEGYARGIADVVRSQGLYNLNSSVAAINLSEARRREIENAKRWVETYFEIREINKRVFRAEQQRLRATPEEWTSSSQAKRPRRLGPNELDSVTGEICWPMLLTSRDLAACRIELEKAFIDRAYHGIMSTDTYSRVRRLTDNLIASLKTRIHDLPADKYLDTKRFLQSLAYEASQPAA